MPRMPWDIVEGLQYCRHLDNQLADRSGKKTKIYHNEIGLKGAYLDHRVSLNAAIFNTVYRDFQVQTFDVPLAQPCHRPSWIQGMRERAVWKSIRW